MAKMFAIFVVFVLFDFSWSARKPKTSFRSGTRSPRRPNIIFVLVDDMDKELGSPNVMKKTQKILRQEGADFVNAFVTTPMCCPSRTSILTGKYAHNHYTFTNNWNCSSPSWRRGPEKKSYARYLELAGYVTGHFGKYLNEYDGSWVPVGWKRWEGLLHNSKFYNYTLRHNTYKERHKMSYEHDYFTDLITNRSISFIRRTKATRPDSPFLAVLSHSAPHGPETAAPQYSTAFPDAKAPRFPNWNFISQDKQWILREKQPMDAKKMAFVDLLHRRRLQTLLSVDDSIARIFSTLQSLGIENETYIFFTSDHGYHLGQFGLVKGKSMPFESDIRVPFYVRGPIIPKNIRMKEMILNIDIAPTFLDIAGLNVPKDMDGTSIMKLFRKSKNGRRSKRRMNIVWRDTILIERSRGWRRSKNLLNANSKKSIFEGKSRNRTQTGKERKMTMLEQICSKSKHQSPCQPKQLWECVTVDGRPRMRKCRKPGVTQATTIPATRPTPSTVPTTPVKMCICMKPRPGMQMYENQGDMLPYDGELLVGGMDYFSTSELRRRSKRSRYSFSSRDRRNRNEFNARRYYKELARAQKLQNRRAKSRMLLRTPITGTKYKPNGTEAEAGPYDTAGVQEVVEEKLGKLKEKIWEARMRLGALRDRRKKLLLISARDRLIEYPCPCNPGNGTKPERATAASVHNGGKEDDDEEEEPQILPKRRRNKQPQMVSRKREPKKKKKTSLRRSKCSSPGVNCFYQTNDHWRLPPFWTGGEFCFCPNAANNSYWCLRTINATHNFLYCEFITHFLEFFDLNQDPYQLYNVIHEVNPAVLSELHKQLNRMRACKGEDCHHYHGKKYAEFNTTSAPLTATPSLSTSKQTVATSNGTSDGESIVNNNGGVTVLNKTNGILFPTVSSSPKTSLESSSSPLTPESRSEVLGNRSEGLVSTPESVVDSSEFSTSVESSTLTPTEARIKTEEHLENKPTERKNLERRKEKSSPENRESKDKQKSLNKSKKSKKKSSAKESSTGPTKSTIPLTSKSRSEEFRNHSEGFVNTSESAVDSSETTESSKVSPFTTLAPTEARVKTDGSLKPTEEKTSKRRKSKTSVEKGERKEDTKSEKETQKSLKKSKKSKKKSAKKRLPLPTNTIDSDKPTEAPRNFSYQSSKSAENGKSKGEKTIRENIEKPTESAVKLTTGSDEEPTFFVKTSEHEQGYLETRLSTVLPTSLTTVSSEETTSAINLGEYSTVKPTRRKSAKRRKTGGKEGKETLKKSKKLRKTKKKSSGKGVSLMNLNTDSGKYEEVLKVSENQTRVETKSETERPRKHEGSQEGNKPLTEISRKRNKKPSGKRLNRNSRKRSKKPSKRPKPSQISEGGVAEGGSASPVEGGGGYISPSDP